MRWPPREGSELYERQLKRNRERLGRRKRKAGRLIRNLLPGRDRSRVTETGREGGDGSGFGLSSATCNGCSRVAYIAIGRSAQSVHGTKFLTPIPHFGPILLMTTISLPPRDLYHSSPNDHRGIPGARAFAIVRHPDHFPHGS